MAELFINVFALFMVPVWASENSMVDFFRNDAVSKLGFGDSMTAPQTFFVYMLF